MGFNDQRFLGIIVYSTKNEYSSLYGLLNMSLTGDYYIAPLCDYLHSFMNSIYPNSDGLSIKMSFGLQVDENWFDVNSGDV